MKGFIPLLLIFSVICSEGYSQYSYGDESPLISGISSIGESTLSPFSDFHFDKVILPPGYRMKRIGSSLALAGGAFFIGGIVMIANADDSNQTSGPGYYDPDPKLLYGSLMILGGIGMVVPGIILWVRGTKKYNRYLENLHGSVSLNRSGLVVRLTF